MQILANEVSGPYFILTNQNEWLCTNYKTGRSRLQGNQTKKSKVNETVLNGHSLVSFRVIFAVNSEPVRMFMGTLL